MKTYYRVFIFALISLLSTTALAQGVDENSFFDEEGMLASETDSLAVPSNMATAIPFDERTPIEYNNPRTDDIKWTKTVYRIIDLREKINYPLYFPEEASDNRQSLFTTIFRLYEAGKITAYQYQDNKEIFTEETMIPFDKFIKDTEIILTVKVDSISGDTLAVEIDESSIPNREVLKYYAKECWYFDMHNSVVSVRLMALCPIWYEQDFELGLQKRPLFWTTFEGLRPHLAKQEALISDQNNGARESMDDLFIKRRFGSYIFKESTTMNRNLLQYNNTAEEMHKEQERIKTFIMNFELDMWEY